METETLQVFLPYPSFAHSVACLDRARLGKQRLECEQILTALRYAETGEKYRKGDPEVSPMIGSKAVGWTLHPATRMWRGYHSALGVYMTMCVNEWTARGYVNTMVCPYQADWTPAPLYHWGHGMLPISKVELPPWLGDAALHASHRSSLLRKDPDWYGQFGWTDPTDLSYVWPVINKAENA